VIGDYINKIGVAAPVFNATMPVYASAFAHGHLNDDAASVCHVLELASGLERK
jgi:hypothetical protein